MQRRVWITAAVVAAAAILFAAASVAAERQECAYLNYLQGASVVTVPLNDTDPTYENCQRHPDGPCISADMLNAVHADRRGRYACPVLDVPSSALAPLELAIEYAAHTSLVHYAPSAPAPAFVRPPLDVYVIGHTTPLGVYRPAAMYMYTGCRSQLRGFVGARNLTVATLSCNVTELIGDLIESYPTANLSRLEQSGFSVVICAPLDAVARAPGAADDDMAIYMPGMRGCGDFDCGRYPEYATVLETQDTPFIQTAELGRISVARDCVRVPRAADTNEPQPVADHPTPAPVLSAPEEGSFQPSPRALRDYLTLAGVLGATCVAFALVLIIRAIVNARRRRREHAYNVWSQRSAQMQPTDMSVMTEVTVDIASDEVSTSGSMQRLMQKSHHAAGLAADAGTAVTAHKRRSGVAGDVIL